MYKIYCYIWPVQFTLICFKHTCPTRENVFKPSVSEWVAFHHILEVLHLNPGWKARYPNWRVSSSGMWRHVVSSVATDVSEEHVASIFRVEETISASKQVRYKETQMCTTVHTKRSFTNCRFLQQDVWFACMSHSLSSKCMTAVILQVSTVFYL
jgi:hypothetical protein